MTSIISIPDNGYKNKKDLSEEQLKNLSLIAGCTVNNLCERDENESTLLVFPNSLDAYGDKISESTIIDIQGDTIFTRNLMGFVGCGDTRLRIHSRFDIGEKDYFMHYLLEKVFSFYLFDLKYNTDTESVFDFVLFLFPFFLKKALTQGLYKEYVTRQHNDDRVKGVIDIPRHIRLNIPFTGHVAYKTREQTTDNDLMELIRHTIEYIRSKEIGVDILSCDEEMKTDVSMVIDATAGYEKNERSRIINKNLRAKIHPYYSEYEPLRKICLKILRHEELKYGKNDDTVYGVLFDGAWLWEEYLNTILEGLGFTHSNSILNQGAIPLFRPKHGTHHDDLNDESNKRYPDFYSTTMVLDAKYKRYSEKDVKKISREDLAQVISYMYIMKLNLGGFLVPGGEKAEIKHEVLEGYGGTLFLLNLPVAKKASSYEDFCKTMASQEKTFTDIISNLCTETPSTPFL